MTSLLDNPLYATLVDCLADEYQDTKTIAVGALPRLNALLPNPPEPNQRSPFDASDVFNMLAHLAADNQVSRRIDQHPVHSGFVQTTFSYKRAGGQSCQP